MCSTYVIRKIKLQIRFWKENGSISKLTTPALLPRGAGRKETICSISFLNIFLEGKTTMSSYIRFNYSSFSIKEWGFVYHLLFLEYLFFYFIQCNFCKTCYNWYCITCIWICVKLFFLIVHFDKCMGFKEDNMKTMASLFLLGNQVKHYLCYMHQFSLLFENSILTTGQINLLFIR